MKKVIFLILSSHDNPIYDINREIMRMYFKKTQVEYGFKYFFIEYKEMDAGVDYRLEYDTLYINGVEAFELILHKTHKAFNYINEEYDYDIVIRTNLSSFWNMPVLYRFLDKLDDKGVATGVCGNDGYTFISGSGIFLSQDVCLLLCDKMDYIDGLIDDVCIGANLSRFINIVPTNNIRYNLVNGPTDIIPDDISNIVYFRVLTFYDRMKYDIPVMVKLAKKLYDIDVDLVKIKESVGLYI
jgi:hypothetical protein